MDEYKKMAAQAALEYIQSHYKGSMIGIGTGSTVNFFIDALAASSLKNKLDGVVSSSNKSTEKLKKRGFYIQDLNSVNNDDMFFYVDGADCIDAHLNVIKGGGGAHTREKIVAAVAKQFICIADESKYVDRLNTETVALPVEVIPMARSYVAREIVKLGGTPVYRAGFVTDNQNSILDVYNLTLQEPLKIESLLNNITGVVGHGLFAARRADRVLLGGKGGVRIINE